MLLDTFRALAFLTQGMKRVPRLLHDVLGSRHLVGYVIDECPLINVLFASTSSTRPLCISMSATL